MTEANVEVTNEDGAVSLPINDSINSGASNNTNIDNISKDIYTQVILNKYWFCHWHVQQEFEFLLGRGEYSVLVTLPNRGGGKKKYVGVGQNEKINLDHKQ